jgi:hypothetical protein
MRRTRSWPMLLPRRAPISSGPASSNLHGQISAAATPGRDAPLRLLQAAKVIEPLDLPSAKETYLQAWWAAVLAGQYAAAGGTLIEISEAARGLPPTARQRPCDLLLDGLAALVTEGREAAAPSLRRAIDLYLNDQVSPEDWLQWGRSATTAAYTLWDVDSWVELSHRQVARARARPALSPRWS